MECFGLTLMSHGILVIDGSTALPDLLAFQRFPTPGSETKSVGLTLITILVV